MDVNHRSSLYIEKKIKAFLVFFSLLLLINCKNKQETLLYTLDFSNNQKASRLIFSGDGNREDYTVKLKGKTQSVFGDLQKEGSSFVFTPIIPFTSGEIYEVFKNDQVYFDFSVPEVERLQAPKLLGIYPKTDTVPENLLKMYFTFDSPMQQTRPTLDFIKIYNTIEHKEVEIFLPLKNELWNRDKTRLTLWLDPGRIKKDLIPNLERGIPIQQGNTYKIEVSPALEDQDGNALYKTYSKSFYVDERDEVKPHVNSWQLTVPDKHTKSGLGINFHEFLDAFLVEETINIYKNEAEIQGSFFISKKANSVVFIPVQPWKKGNYQIKIESRLEDLAGNNLNRLFDEDLTQNKELSNSKFKVLEFVIK